MSNPEAWVIEKLSQRNRPQVVASYKGFLKIINTWTNLDDYPYTQAESNCIKALKDRTLPISSRKQQLMQIMLDMWRISEKYWDKYCDKDPMGYDKYESIHWINHDFLMILNPQAYDYENRLQEGDEIINRKMFPKSLYQKNKYRKRLSIRRRRKRCPCGTKVNSRYQVCHNCGESIPQ